MSNVIGFLIGIIVGGVMGVILMGLMVAAGDYDRMEEEELHGRSDQQTGGD